MDEQKQLKNLLNDRNSVFYSADKINILLLNKGRRSSNEKDKVFYRIFNLIDQKDVIYDDNDYENKPRIPFLHPLLNRKKISIDRRLFTQLTVPLNFFILMLHI